MGAKVNKIFLHLFADGWPRFALWEGSARGPGGGRRRGRPGGLIACERFSQARPVERGTGIVFDLGAAGRSSLNMSVAEDAAE